jgi:hypothetical protein
LACIYLSLTFMFQFLQTLVSHVSFSVVAVVLYLEPVQEALRMAKAVADSIQISVKSKKETEETKDDPENDDDEGKGGTLNSLRKAILPSRPQETQPVSDGHADLKNKKRGGISAVSQKAGGYVAKYPPRRFQPRIHAVQRGDPFGVRGRSQTSG